jgi:type II secretory pathway pseudopilin PulG
MLPCTPSTPKCGASERGFTAVELLIGILLMGLAVAATSGMFVASREHMRMQAREVEATQTARAALDMMIRDLRLGGACLPVTGDFISLDGTNSGTQDELITRTGLTRPDLSCIRTAVPTGATVTKSGSTVTVSNSEGFAAGMRAYIRHPDGEGEYFDITGVTSPTRLTKGTTLSRDYPETSGVYAIDERRFFIQWRETARGAQPQLLLQTGSSDPQPFAVGIEKLDVRYQLRRNCPPCDVKNLPANNDEWSIVDQVLLTVTARSEVPDHNGNYYRRTMTVGVKPRNLLPE